MSRFSRLVAAVVSLLAVAPQFAKAEPIGIALPVASLESMPIYVAEEKGFFKRNGIDVDIITSRGGGEAMKAFLSGDVQIVATGFPEVGLMRARGVGVELFFAQNARVPFALITRKDLGLKSVAELKGKIVAVTSPGSLTSILGRYFVQQAGLDAEKDVTIISVGGGGEILGALKSGRADAAMLFEPFVTIALQQGLADMLVDVPEKLDAFSSSALTTNKAFFDKAPKEAHALFDALAEALTFIHADKAGTLEVAKKRFANADAKVLEAALARMEKWFSKDGRFTHTNIDATQRIALALKVMPLTFTYDEVVSAMAREGPQ